MVGCIFLRPGGTATGIEVEAIPVEGSALKFWIAVTGLEKLSAPPPPDRELAPTLAKLMP